MLDYEGEDFQETFMATFQVSFSDMFDNAQTFNLREEGDKIAVTLENRQVRMILTMTLVNTCVTYTCTCMYIRHVNSLWATFSAECFLL